YLVRGAAFDVRLHTPSTFTKIRLDHLPDSNAPTLPLVNSGQDDGLLVDARGATRAGEVDMAWDADAIRGRRGVAASTDIEEAAKPWDRASAEAALRLGPFTAAQGVRVVTRRGGSAGDLDAVGPTTTLRVSDAATDHILYDATVEGGALRLAST